MCLFEALSTCKNCLQVIWKSFLGVLVTTGVFCYLPVVTQHTVRKSSRELGSLFKGNNLAAVLHFQPELVKCRLALLTSVCVTLCLEEPLLFVNLLLLCVWWGWWVSPGFLWLSRYLFFSFPSLTRIYFHTLLGQEGSRMTISAGLKTESFWSCMAIRWESLSIWTKKVLTLPSCVLIAIKSFPE